MLGETRDIAPPHNAGRQK